MAFCIIAFLGTLEKGNNNAIWRCSFSPGGCSEGARKGGADTFHHQVGGLSLRNYMISRCSHRNDEMLRERAERKARPRSLVHQAAMEEDNHEGEEPVEVREE